MKPFFWLNMNFYPHHIGDFDKATRHLTRIERSIYRDLIELYYDIEKQLPLDSGWICRKIIANSNEEATLVEQALNEFFTKTPTGWYHDRCEHEIDHFRNSQSQKALAGKASAAARALKRQQALNGRSTDVEQTYHGAPTNQEPVTINQEPVTKKTKSASPPPTFDLPDWIDVEHWNAWHTCAKRRNATPAQKAVSLGKLASWREQGLDYAGALENAAAGGYQGLFLPDAPKGSNSSETAYQRSMREKYEVAAPSVAAVNPSAKRIDPNAYFDALPTSKPVLGISNG